MSCDASACTTNPLKRQGRLPTRDGDEWLDRLVLYLDGNRRLLNEAIEGIPGLSVMNLEATYLAWVDFAGTGMAREEFVERPAKF